MQEQRMPSEQEAAGQATESMGVEPEHEQGEQVAESHEQPNEGSQDALYVQKRLKQQKRAHEREMRSMQEQLAQMQSRMQPQQSSQDMHNPYTGQPRPANESDDTIQRAVSFALNHRDNVEKQQREQQQAAHVNKQYRELQKHLDSMGDKYDDFGDVVMGEDAQFTPSMRDYSLTLPKTGKGSAGEVLYQLGKNPSELERISKLHPLDQASEMMKLSHALISGGDNKPSQPKPLGNIKSNPTSNSSHTVTDKTPVSSIRQRMKSGTWK